MQYLFIFESIGTSELMLIGLVALIVFGPRKIPELARTVGKTMAEFRRSTDDFKKTWEREAGFTEGENSIENGIKSLLGKNELETTVKNEEVFTPEIKKLSKEDFEKNLSKEKNTKTESSQIVATGKQDWI